MAPRSYSKTYSNYTFQDEPCYTEKMLTLGTLEVPRRPFEAARLLVLPATEHELVSAYAVGLLLKSAY